MKYGQKLKYFLIFETIIGPGDKQGMYHGNCFMALEDIMVGFIGTFSVIP